MAKDFMTDEQVEMEIDRLLHSDAVQLAKKEIRIKYKRRQYMYQLRNMEKRGKQLKAEGLCKSGDAANDVGTKCALRIESRCTRHRFAGFFINKTRVKRCCANVKEHSCRFVLKRGKGRDLPKLAFCILV